MTFQDSATSLVSFIAPAMALTDSGSWVSQSVAALLRKVTQALRQPGILEAHSLSRACLFSRTLSVSSAHFPVFSSRRQRRNVWTFKEYLSQVASSPKVTDSRMTRARSCRPQCFSPLVAMVVSALVQPAQLPLNHPFAYGRAQRLSSPLLQPDYPARRRVKLRTEPLWRNVDDSAAGRRTGRHQASVSRAATFTVTDFSTSSGFSTAYWSS